MRSVFDRLGRAAPAAPAGAPPDNCHDQDYAQDEKNGFDAHGETVRDAAFAAMGLHPGTAIRREPRRGGTVQNSMRADVIVVGAGLAGLAAARKLAQAGRSVLLLEARPRVGGRVFSVPAPGLPRGIELGAEFIHGGDPTLAAALRRAGTRPIDVPREMWVRDARGLHPARAYWAEIVERAETIPPQSGLPLAKTRAARRGPPEVRTRLRSFVEGFYAAPAGEVSARSIRDDGAGASASLRRPESGYAPVIVRLAADVRAAGARIRMGEVVRELRWQRGAVAARTSRGTHLAAAVIVTVPLGVLRQRGLTLRPRVREKEHAIAHIGWGEVARITLRFRSDFWRRGPLPPELRRRGRPAFGFLTCPAADFPTWWVPDPRLPLLVGWSGGPRARELTRLPASRWRARALAALSETVGVPAAKLRPWVRTSWQHNWSADPFTRGAYSHPLAGRESARKRLARPVAGTLFFAGEATAEESGTVQGALGSGERAAREVLSLRDW